MADEKRRSCSISDEEEVEILEEDYDDCDDFELERAFQTKYNIADETAVSLKKDYILHLALDTNLTRVAAGISDGTVQIFDINEQRGLSHSNVDSISSPILFNNQKETIANCGVRFLDDSPNCLFVGHGNGLIRLFDLRTNQKKVAEFDTKSKEDDSCRTITSFDRNANQRILCAGTEQHRSEVFLFFYDIRERKTLGCYSESHNDDVTAVQFHEKDPDLLISGSTDGCINLYNIREQDEDDALFLTFNTECSVNKLAWHKNSENVDLISCITDVNSFNIYETKEEEVLAYFDRDGITKAVRRKSPANCNVIGAHTMKDGTVFLLAGTNHKKGEVLRSLRLKDNKLMPLGNFDGNKQIIRDSVYHAESNVLLTAGESGLVTLWSPKSNDVSHTDVKSKQSKAKTKLKSNKITPY